MRNIENTLIDLWTSWSFAMGASFLPVQILLDVAEDWHLVWLDTLQYKKKNIV